MLKCRMMRNAGGFANLPPRPTRRRANPTQRRGTVRVVREYRNRGSHDPPSVSSHQGQLPLWSKRAYRSNKTTILIENKTKEERRQSLCDVQRCGPQNSILLLSKGTQLVYTRLNHADMQNNIKKDACERKWQDMRNEVRVDTYSVINASGFPPEGKRSIRLVFFLRLWRPRMNLRRKSNIKNKVQNSDFKNQLDVSAPPNCHITIKENEMFVYLWKGLIVWAGKVVLVEVFRVKQGGASMQGGRERWHFGLLLVFPFGSDHFCFFRLRRQEKLFYLIYLYLLILSLRSNLTLVL